MLLCGPFDLDVNSALFGVVQKVAVGNHLVPVLAINTRAPFIFAQDNKSNYRITIIISHRKH